MLQRIKEYGERATGTRMPEPRDKLVHDLATDLYIDPNSVSSLLTEAKRERRRWRMDVAKCAISDVVGRAIHGGQPRYGKSTETIKSREG